MWFSVILRDLCVISTQNTSIDVLSGVWEGYQRDYRVIPTWFSVIRRDQGLGGDIDQWDIIIHPNSDKTHEI